MRIIPQVALLQVAQSFCRLFVACLAAVVKQGEIVEQGRHADLVQIPDGAYATLVRLQASAQRPTQSPALQQVELDPLQPYEQQPREEQPETSAASQVLQELITSQVWMLLPTC